MLTSHQNHLAPASLSACRFDAVKPDLETTLSALDTNIHASCIAVDGKGLLILGDSGSGKSSLALALMAFGAELVSDDRVLLSLEDEKIKAQAPTAISGMIEARGVGILNSSYLPHVYINVVVNMQKTERMRLPEKKSFDILGVSIPCYHRSDNPSFPAAILQLLKSGRHS
jgi:HPr kinase/phosphorylase